MDITDEAQIKDCCETVLNDFQHIDGLVNNAANNPKVESAGVNEESRLENFSLKNWNADVAVGLSGAFLCTKYFGLAIAKQGGSIVNISSDLGVIAPDQRLYENQVRSSSSTNKTSNLLSYQKWTDRPHALYVNVLGKSRSAL